MKSHASKANNEQKKNKNAYEMNTVIDTLELPKDIFWGLPLLSMEGNRSLCITNHRGIVRYSREKIVIATRNGNIEIAGSELLIPKFTKDIIEIRGYLEGVTFL